MNLNTRFCFDGMVESTVTLHGRNQDEVTSSVISWMTFGVLPHRQYNPLLLSSQKLPGDMDGVHPGLDWSRGEKSLLTVQWR